MNSPNKEVIDMSVKDEIITKFYDEHGKTNAIAKEIGVRPSYVTKVIQKDKRKYNEEKERRARLQREKRKKYKSDWITKKRNSNKEIDELVKMQHIQASKELSSHNEISNMAFAKWNRSAFTYSKNSSDLVLKRKNIYTSDSPKRVSNIVSASCIKKDRVF